MGIWRDRDRSDKRAPRTSPGDDWEEPDNGVAQAAARMLAGKAASMVSERGRQAPPAWAYLNALAHGSVQDLYRLAAADGRRDPGGWEATASYLASDMLAYDDDPKHIRDTQREVLIPLELDFLDDRFDQPSTPVEFAGTVMRALERHRTWS